MLALNLVGTKALVAYAVVIVILIAVGFYVARGRSRY